MSPPSATKIPAPSISTGDAAWPVRLRDLARSIHDADDPSARERLLGQAWLLLNGAISRFLRGQRTRFRRLQPDDIQDIASQKSLEILRQIDSGSWSIQDRSPQEVAGYLSGVVRHGLVDHGRRASRRVEIPLPEEIDRMEAGDGIPGMASLVERPDALAQRREFATALVECARRLAGRSRMVWILRVFGGLSSREIAAHPEVAVTPAHVDVLLQRTRGALRACMEQKGHDTREIPPGTFTELWKAFYLPASEETLDAPAAR